MQKSAKHKWKQCPAMNARPYHERLNLTLAGAPDLNLISKKERRFLMTQPRYTLSDLCQWAAFSKFETQEGLPNVAESQAFRDMLNVYWTAHNEEAPKHGWIGVGCITFAEDALTETVKARPEIVNWIERSRKLP